MGCTNSSLNASDNDDVIRITRRIQDQLQKLKENQDSSKSDKEKSKVYGSTDFFVSDCLRRIITLAKTKSKFEDTDLNQLLVTINLINRDQPEMAKKLSWLIATALHLVEERVVTDNEDSDGIKAKIGHEESSQHQCGGSVRTNATSLWDSVAYHTAHLGQPQRGLNAEPTPRDTAAETTQKLGNNTSSKLGMGRVPSLRGLDTNDGACDFGFFDMSQHSSGKSPSNSYNNLAFLASLPPLPPMQKPSTSSHELRTLSTLDNDLTIAPESQRTTVETTSTSCSNDRIEVMLRYSASHLALVAPTLPSSSIVRSNRLGTIPPMMAPSQSSSLPQRGIVVDAPAHTTSSEIVDHSTLSHQLVDAPTNDISAKSNSSRKAIDQETATETRILPQELQGQLELGPQLQSERDH
jgi:hypothetical protein